MDNDHSLNSQYLKYQRKRAEVVKQWVKLKFMYK